MATEGTPGDFGRKLREARERRGITLRQIANTTKISFGQLESLERNDISKLPGGIFSRAFVRSYALEVGLDPEATIQEFIAQFPHDSVTIGHPTSTQVEDSEALESERRVAGTSLWLLAISIPGGGRGRVLQHGRAQRDDDAAGRDCGVGACGPGTGAWHFRPSSSRRLPATSPLTPLRGRRRASAERGAGSAGAAAASPAPAPTEAARGGGRPAGRRVGAASVLGLRQRGRAEGDRAPAAGGGAAHARRAPRTGDHGR